MKKGLFSITSAILILLLTFLGLTSCGGDEPPAVPTKLSAPVLTLTENTASWAADTNADKFEISLDGALSYVENTVTSKALESGQTIKVRAIGDGTSYSTSDWSNSVTYTVSTPDPTPIKLGTPVVTVSNTGLASWAAVANAQSYIYKINGGAETATGATSVQLASGDSIVVKAVGDGTAYTDGDFSAAVTYTAGTPSPTPVKLGTPVVTVSNTGLASWAAVANAQSYIYKINGGAETATGATSVQLASGDSIVVKAVGDGTAYTDGDFSAAVTYTAGSPSPNPPSESGAPAYLGILASTYEPSAMSGVPESIGGASPLSLRRMARGGGAYMSFDQVLIEYYKNSTNHIGTALPETSSYDAYSRAGETVYVQIWLNNPNQHTILSLMLNGTKYQVGGGLSSFFVEESGVHYNCVYVAVTLPATAHTEMTYEVTNIEYIADTYINADGTDEFMNNNDTVSIGLPYDTANPTVTDFLPGIVTVNSCSATLKVTDSDGLLSLTGGWLGIAVYDGERIIANKALAVGDNSVDATGLVEGTYYWIVVYLYADLHDGRGVTAHTLYQQSMMTPTAITVGEIDGALLYDSEKDGYYGALKVSTTLNSDTAEYIKLEILDEQGEVILTDESYNGSATVSNGILNGRGYDVRVYYKDTEYPEGKYIEEYAWVGYLGTPWLQNNGTYSFINDAVYYFELSNGDGDYPAIESLVIRFYEEESARWVASEVLYLIDNPTFIEDTEEEIESLRAQFNEAYGNSDLMNQLHAEMSRLEEMLRPYKYALWYVESRADNNLERDYWATVAALGKYYYELEYNGTDTEEIFKVGKTYFVVLDDLYSLGIDGIQADIDFKYDKNEGTELTEDKAEDQFNLHRALTDHWVLMENLTYSDGELTLTLYNEPEWGSEERPPFAIGYVYKVIVDGEVLYLDESTHTLDIDEAAWFDEYISRVTAGESVEGLMEKYVPDYEPSYTFTVDDEKLTPGSKYFEVYLRLVETEYEEDGDHAMRSAHLDIYKKLPTPTISFNEYEGEVIVSADGWWGSCEYEAIDKNGNPYTLSTEGGRRFELPAAGTKVRAKLLESGHWFESDFSEWYTFSGIQYAAPVLGEYNTDTCTVSWGRDESENISHYVYTINGGSPVIVYPSGLLSVVLENGDVLRVKAVPVADSVYYDSAWSEYTCTDDRTSLAVPTGFRYDSAQGALVWDTVEGAQRYIIEETYNGETRTFYYGKTSYSEMIAGAVYRVRSYPKPGGDTRASGWSEAVIAG